MINRFQGMSKKIRHAANRISIQMLISISFTIVSVFGMAFMGITMYTHFMNVSKDNSIENNKQIVDRLSWNLNDYLRNMMSVSDAMYYNVIKNKDMTHDTITKELNLLYEANKTNLTGIACISEDGALISASPVATRKKGVDLKLQEWFQSAEDKIENMHFSTPHVQNIFESSNYRYYWVVSLSRSIELTYLGNIRRGVLLVDMNYSAIEQMFEKVNEGTKGYVYLIDQNGEIIYHPKQKAVYSGLVKENNLIAAEYDDGDHMEVFQGEERAVIVKTVGYTGWKIVSVLPMKALKMDLIHLRYFMILIAFITVYLLLLGNLFISGRITDPIRRLEFSINQLEEGNMDAENIYIGGSHEIRHLGRTVKTMVNQMHKLMNDMVKEQEEKTKSELDALQSQINPHFLYNTLDSVVWMIESERNQGAISMVTALASLFRISLSKGNNIITIKDEITHARNYLNIQKVRYKNRFDVDISIDPQIEQCATIKLIVQPLLENAIYYGVGHMEDDGLITIKGYEKEGDIYIDVSDNGMGIPEETVENLLKNKAKARGKGSGIGLWNVNERIRLYFKGEYGLTITSELDEGTTVSIHLPKIPYEQYEKGKEGGRS